MDGINSTYMYVHLLCMQMLYIKLYVIRYTYVFTFAFHFPFK